MRIPYISLLMVLMLVTVTSCFKEKSIDSTDGSTTGGGSGTGGGGGGSTSGNKFEVKINGQLNIFNVQTATLLRSTATDQKRMDIQGISTDGTRRLIITIGDRPAAGNAVTLKEYVIDLFNVDDPNTPEDESAGNDDGFITWSEKTGSSWITDVYAQKGVMKVTVCDAAAKKITGTFSLRDSSYGTSEIRNFTEGKFNSISYVVLN